VVLAGGADEPPMIMLHSRPDDKHMVVWFRDYDLLVPHFHHKIMTLGTAAVIFLCEIILLLMLIII
jgi:hypothetical protein